MDLRFFIGLPLILTGCSLAISPTFPADVSEDAAIAIPAMDMGIGMDSALDSSQAKEDMNVMTDLGQPEIVDSAIADMAPMDQDVPPSRVCEDWTNCHSGEVCVDGTCTDSTPELCAAEASLEVIRTFSDELGCCLPEDEEVNGACIFPLEASIGLNDAIQIVSWTQQSRQFSVDDCDTGTESSPPIQSDIVFEVPLPSESSPFYCVALNLTNETINSQSSEQPVLLEMDAFALSSCCEQDLEVRLEQCGKPAGETSKRWFNVSANDLTSIRFNVRLRHRDLSEAEVIEFQEAEFVTGPMFGVQYSITSDACCNVNEDCIPYAPPGETRNCTAENYCE